MLILKNIVCPTENILISLNEVVAHWEKDCLGKGNLILTERNLFWQNQSTNDGFKLSYPAICVHAISGSSEDFPESCLFLIIDVSKTDIDYTPEPIDVDNEMSSEEGITVAVRFVPADSASMGEVYSIMNKCQELNPDPDDEQISDNDNNDEECDDEPIQENGHCDDEDEHNEHSWFTSDTATDEIHLSPEGRANLERILGNINNEDDAQSYPQRPPNFEPDDDVMDQQ